MTDTPSLSELAWKLGEVSKWLKTLHTQHPNPPHLAINLARYDIDEAAKVLSRLSGNGGGAGASPLEESDARRAEIVETLDSIADDVIECGCDDHAVRLGRDGAADVKAAADMLRNGVGAATPSASLEEVEDDMRETAAAVAKDVRDQNWKMGGVLYIDTDEAADMIFRAIRDWAARVLTSSAAPQAQAAPPPNLEPQCGVGKT